MLAHPLAGLLSSHAAAAGDDDDYFNFDDEGGDGDGDRFFRTVIKQLYTPEAINAVLQEWFRTLATLPAIIRQSVELGLFSSAQLVRFLSMDVRPGMTRAFTRSLPPAVSSLGLPLRAVRGACSRSALVADAILKVLLGHAAHGPLRRTEQPRLLP